MFVGSEFDFDFVPYKGSGKTVGGDDACSLLENTIPGTPAVEDAHARNFRGKLSDGDGVEKSDENEFSVFLPFDIITEQAYL